MDRRKRVVKNVVLLTVLSYLFLNVTGLHLSAIAAHRHSERSIHYGPSQVVHTESFPGGKLILGKYDRWISCNTARRTLVVFWTIGSGSFGYEYDPSKQLDYSWASNYGFYWLYGIINDERIGRVEITLDDDTVLSRTDFHDGMFLFSWEASGGASYIKAVRGYESDGNLVFEEERYIPR